MNRVQRVFIAVSIISSCCILEASAQIYVTIRPSRPVYTRTVAPGPGYIWIEEDWNVNGDGYEWRGGYWSAPPQRGYRYTKGHWNHSSRGDHWTPGRWHSGPRSNTAHRKNSNSRVHHGNGQPKDHRNSGGGGHKGGHGHHGGKK